MGSRTKKNIGAVIYHVFSCLFGFVMIYPLIWMLISSFKPTNDIYKTAASLIPQPFVLDNYPNGWKGFGGVSFSVFIKNSLFVSTLSTIGAVISSTFVAFGFARLRFHGRKIWFACVMITMMLPFQIVMIPQYIIFNKLGWVNTFLPLIVPNFFGGAFFIFLTMQFFMGIPRDLDEAAKIDGCSVYGIFFRILMPLVTPAMVTCTIFSFMWTWDNFLASMIYLNKPDIYTVSIALRMFIDPSSISDFGATLAMSVVSLLPIFFIFIFFQKYLVEGISTEGLKG